MLQSRPMTAPGRMWANAQTRVPSPTLVDSTSALGCLNVDTFISVEYRPRRDHVVGSPLGVFHRAPNVSADDSKPQTIERTEKHDHQHGSRVAGHRDPSTQLGADNDAGAHHAADGSDHADPEQNP